MTARIQFQHVTRIPGLLTGGVSESTTDLVTSEDTEATSKGKEKDLGPDVAMLIEMSLPPIILNAPKEKSLVTEKSTKGQANDSPEDEAGTVETSNTGQTDDEKQKGVNPLTVARAYTSGIVCVASSATLIAYCLDGGGVAQEYFLGILISTMSLSGIVLAKYGYDLFGQIRGQS